METLYGSYPACIYITRNALTTGLYVLSLVLPVWSLLRLLYCPVMRLVQTNLRSKVMCSLACSH